MFQLKARIMRIMLTVWQTVADTLNWCKTVGSLMTTFQQPWNGCPLRLIFLFNWDEISNQSGHVGESWSAFHINSFMPVLWQSHFSIDCPSCSADSSSRSQAKVQIWLHWVFKMCVAAQGSMKCARILMQHTHALGWLMWAAFENHFLSICLWECSRPQIQSESHFKFRETMGMHCSD